MERQGKLRLGESLVEAGLITPDQLRIALKEQEGSGLPLGQQLVALGFVTEAVIRDMVAQTMGQEAVDLDTVVADLEALRLVPEDFARRHNLLPLAFDREKNVLVVAVADVFNVLALDKLRALVDRRVKVKALLAGLAQLSEYIDLFYGYELSVDGILREIATGEVDSRALEQQGGETGYTQPVVRLVGALLTDAVKRGASDIHFEPEQAFLRIRYRIDGVLEQVRSLHKTYWPAIAVRLKVIAGINIAETRAAQDGRFTLNLNGRPIDFRVSTQPTIWGENIVLRILDRERSIIPLSALGLDDESLALLERMLARPQGILVVTGPTGSGKTTTLYSLLTSINDETVNIMTLEDPVEYPVTLMRQTSLNEAVKMDFVNGIRSIMRQDPDIILVGEIRDRETAEMAFRAAMTGHQVFATLHTNSALGTFPRLLDIGISPEILAGNIIGIVAQRLVRVLCPECKAPYVPTDEERRMLAPLAGPDAVVYGPVGCPHCRYKGYRGRMAIMELLYVDEALDELVARRAAVQELRQAAVRRGFRTLAEEGLRRVLEGRTSLAEVARVVDLTGRIR